MHLRTSWLAGLLLLVGCATYRDDLARGQHFYERNDYPEAMSVWRLLEADLDSLTFSEQARYAYLRGMTDYRMQLQADARHWLAVADALEAAHGGALSSQQAELMRSTLGELTQQLYGVPPEALAAAPAPKAHVGEEPKADASAKRKKKPSGQSCDTDSDCPAGYVCSFAACEPR